MPLAPQAWESTQRRVMANFAQAKFVVLARIVDLRNVERDTGQPRPHAGQLERAQFRVDRVYKGSMQVGDLFVIDTGYYACARPILQTHWGEDFAGGDGGAMGKFPRLWLLYYTPRSAGTEPPFEITTSPLSRPAQFAAYDLAVLDALVDMPPGGQ